MKKRSYQIRLGKVRLAQVRCGQVRLDQDTDKRKRDFLHKIIQLPPQGEYFPRTMVACQTDPNRKTQKERKGCNEIQTNMSAAHNGKGVQKSHSEPSDRRTKRKRGPEPKSIWIQKKENHNPCYQTGPRSSNQKEGRNLVRPHNN